MTVTRAGKPLTQKPKWDGKRSFTGKPKVKGASAPKGEYVEVMGAPLYYIVAEFHSAPTAVLKVGRNLDLATEAFMGCLELTNWRFVRRLRLIDSQRGSDTGRVIREEV